MAVRWYKYAGLPTVATKKCCNDGKPVVLHVIVCCFLKTERSDIVKIVSQFAKVTICFYDKTIKRNTNISKH